MFGGLVDTVLGLVSQYGFLAVFVYMALETAFILHYVPSEVVVPIAAAELVHGPFTFGLFVLDATAGATIGSAVAYLLFGRYGRGVLERYGRVIHVSPDRLDRSEAVFARYGESSVFWGRLLPFVRAFVSIPAGLAGMGFRRFVAFSAGGALVFDTALTYLSYAGAGRTSPLEFATAWIASALAGGVAYAGVHPGVVLSLGGVAAVLAGAAWLARRRIRARPALAKLIGLHALRALGLLVGTAFVFGALAAPDRTLAAAAWVWDDPLFWIHLGFSERVALLLTGVGIAFVGALAYEIGRTVEVAYLRSAVAATAERLRRP